jgi:hypothetical protein
MDNIFEQATRSKLRFQAPQGEVSVEQLWSLKQETLITYEESLLEEVEKFGKTSRRRSVSKTKALSEAELRLAVVGYILDVLAKEQAEASTAKEVKEHNARIDHLIASKKEEKMANLSLEELEALRK